ncbi:MAG: hypothetical protein LAT56_04935, partial [Wenzhouxiangella sp.]|nr:hypothetical protein [Wenzhouxiangella sp.]
MRTLPCLITLTVLIALVATPAALAQDSFGQRHTQPRHWPQQAPQQQQPQAQWPQQAPQQQQPQAQRPQQP